ncbi:MAG TPA: PQQ-binding-like beta-propeller repeat protein, partial [Gemmataceae bacterium]|nr:PQQ-binding-like beta-propeller repeat protein [Gemmataceae bacterium]
MGRAAMSVLGMSVVFVGTLNAGPWTQFRGPNASGLANGNDKLPARIGPKENLIWKVPLPEGISSPVVFGDRVYVTGFRDKKLLTIALDAGTGKILWEREAPYKELEKFLATHGSQVQSTPATDGERVVSFFGSSGLLCYDTDGNLLWHIPMGPFKNDFGAGSS